MKSNKAFPEQRDALDALEALDLAIKHIRGKGDKFSERNPTAVLSQLEGTRSRISHALTNPAVPQHPDDAAVDRFADAMKEKLARARDKGRGGWDDPEQCSDSYLATLLVGHLRKGNAGTFEDVANFAMMLHQRGAIPTTLAEAVNAAPSVPEAVRRLPDEWREQCGTMDNMSRVGMAAADQRRECADELDRAIEQNEEEAERLRSILYPTEGE